jgi:hypothetical protein
MTLLEESILYGKAANLHNQRRLIVEKKGKLVHETLLGELDALCKKEASKKAKRELIHFISEYTEDIHKCYEEYCKLN